MAIIKDAVLLQHVNGTLGKEITIYQRGGKTIMAKKRSPSKKKPTSRQKEARYKMKLAAAYARQILQDPDIKAFYAAKAGPGQNAYNMAIKDAYNSPEIQEVRLEEDTVIVHATDEFRVAQVDIDILDAKGKYIERGKATPDWTGVKWTYHVKNLPKGGKLRVTAINMPGNVTKQEILLE
jgi:hypothetical protein